MNINKKQTFFNAGTNSFKYPIFSPLVIYTPSLSELKNDIYEDIRNYMKPASDVEELLKRMDQICEEEINVGSVIKKIELAVEKKLFEILFRESGINQSIGDRALRIAGQIREAIILNNIKVSTETNYLDFGCGSGVVAATLKNEYNLKKAIITDIVDYRYSEIKKDPELVFEHLDPTYKNINSYGCDFDLITMTNVLHHCNDPRKTFEKVLMYLKTGGHLVIIESCIGVTNDDCKTYAMQPLIPFQELYDSKQQVLEKNWRYLNYDFKEKMIYGIFFDWLYNRTFVNEDINVPYNFGTIKNWNSYWGDLGLSLKNTYLLGFDQPSVLEFHTLHVIQKI